MNIFDFENRIKTHTDNSKGAVDMDRLLAGLDLAPQPRSSYRNLFFSASATLFCIAAIAYFIYPSNITAERSTPINTTEIISTNTPNSKLNSSSSNVLSTVEKEIKTPIKNTSEPIATETKIIQKVRLTDSKKETPKTTNKNTTESYKAASYTPTSNTKEEKSIIPVAVAQKTSDVHVQRKIIAQNTSLQKTNLSTGNSSNNSIAKRSNENINFLPTLMNELPESRPLNLADKVKDCPKFGNRLWHMSIIPEVGYSIPLKSLQLDDEDFRSIYENRLENENSIEGINASLSLQFKNQVTGLYIKPGLSYTRITEQLNFTDIKIQLDTILGITEVTINAAGDTMTTTWDDTVIETKISSKSKVHYQLHEFSLPVAIGYTFAFNNMSLDIEGGIKFNFLQKTSGKILSTENEFADLNGDQKLFKNSVGLGFFGGAFLKKQLSTHSEVYIGPRFTYNTLSFSSNRNPINQRYNIVGLHVGCVYAIF